MDLPTAIRLVRETFKAAAQGKAFMPSKMYLSLPHDGDFRAMPAFLPFLNACGLKWVNVHPHNPHRGLPTVMALIIINDPNTGRPLAVMDGLLVTKLRTAASAAVAAESLARPESQTVGLIGCGAQADAQLLALAELFSIHQVKVWGYLPKEAMHFCQRMKKLFTGIRWEVCSTLKSCARDVDILVTLTPSRRPLIKRAWLSPGTHINAIGADGPGKQELDLKILQDATVVVDDRPQALHGGEINVPIHRGQFHPRNIYATLGEILVRRKTLRRQPDSLTVFDSTGLATHDVALGQEIARRASARGIGLRVDFHKPS